GMLTTNDEGYAERASIMRLHGIHGDAWKRYSRSGSWHYRVLHAGFKLNLCDLLAAIGSTQLRKCDNLWKRRCWIRNLYNERFSNVDEVQTPPFPSAGSEHSWHLYILRLRRELLEINRNQFIDELKEVGIGTSVHFIPLHHHPFYISAYGYRPGSMPN